MYGHKLKNYRIRFYKHGERIEFNIWTDLPNAFGLSLDAAVENWANRTEEHTPESLCSYINSKPIGYIALTEAQYEKERQSESSNR